MSKWTGAALALAALTVGTGEARAQGKAACTSTASMTVTTTTTQDPAVEFQQLLDSASTFVSDLESLGVTFRPRDQEQLFFRVMTWYVLVEDNGVKRLQQVFAEVEDMVETVQSFGFTPRARDIGSLLAAFMHAAAQETDGQNDASTTTETTQPTPGSTNQRPSGSQPVRQSPGATSSRTAG